MEGVPFEDSRLVKRHIWERGREQEVVIALQVTSILFAYSYRDHGVSVLVINVKFDSS